MQRRWRDRSGATRAQRAGDCPRPRKRSVAAAQADRRIAAGRARRLEGIPFTVKDLIATAGVAPPPAPGAARPRASWTAPAVERLQRKGAILLGKSNCSEFGIGNLHTGNRLFGETRNPWALDRTPGGSSGGESAAVPAGSPHSGSARTTAARCVGGVLHGRGRRSGPRRGACRRPACCPTAASVRGAR